MNSLREEYEEREHQGLVQKVAEGVQGVLESTLSATPRDKPVTINVNVQINYASGGGATVNVR